MLLVTPISRKYRSIISVIQNSQDATSKEALMKFRNILAAINHKIRFLKKHSLICRDFRFSKIDACHVSQLSEYCEHD